MKKLVILISVMAIGCQNKEDMLVAKDYQNFFEESHKHEIIGNDTIPPPPVPEPFYYSDINFIIDEEGTTYYFKIRNIEKSNSCMPIQKSDFRPEFIGITPDDITEIPASEFENTFHEKIRPEYGRGFFSLASARDTFYSPEWSGLMKRLESQRDVTWAWLLRKMTREEKVVLDYKKSGKKYDPKTIPWDSTTIILPKAWKK